MQIRSLKNCRCYPIIHTLDPGSLVWHKSIQDVISAFVNFCHCAILPNTWNLILKEKHLLLFPFIACLYHAPKNLSEIIFLGLGSSFSISLVKILRGKDSFSFCVSEYVLIDQLIDGSFHLFTGCRILAWHLWFFVRHFKDVPLTHASVVSVKSYLFVLLSWN